MGAVWLTSSYIQPMSPLEVSRPTRRSLRPDAVAYVDPQFPAERLWSPYVRPVHSVERGEDLELTGELTLVDQEPMFTGEQLRGTYEIFWFTGDEVSGVTILAAGSRPVGAVGGGFYGPIDRAAVVLTTREGLGLLPGGGPGGELPAARTVLRGAGTGLLVLPVDTDDEVVPIDVLLDADHRPCGYILNGDLDLATWDVRILPGESGRVSSQDLFTHLQSAPPGHRPEVVTRRSGFLGRPKTTVLGHLGEIALVDRSWEFEVVPASEAMTAGHLVEQLQDTTFRLGPDLGVEARSGPDGSILSWVTEIVHDGTGLQLVLGPEGMSLPDPPL